MNPGFIPFSAGRRNRGRWRGDLVVLAIHMRLQLRATGDCHSHTLAVPNLYPFDFHLCIFIRTLPVVTWSKDQEDSSVFQMSEAATTALQVGRKLRPVPMSNVWHTSRSHTNYISMHRPTVSCYPPTAH
eukprot:COSAG02_NODE_5023_length_4719_cov_21.132900_2_plen_129_part_00